MLQVPGILMYGFRGSPSNFMNGINQIDKGLNMKSVIDNAAGPTGLFGIIIGTLPGNQREWLICCSTMLVLCQLAHWSWRFIRWVKK